MIVTLSYNSKQLAAWRQGRLSIDDLDQNTQTVIEHLRQMLGLPENWQPAEAKPVETESVEAEPELEPTTDIRESIARQI